MSHVVGVFGHVDTTGKAIDVLNGKGIRDYTYYAPTYIEELAVRVDDTPSPVRWITLTGALTGFILAVWLQWYMSSAYPMRESMKPVVSWPAFTIVMFEATVLIGGLFNLAALFIFCGLPKIKPAPGYDPRFTDDKFGIIVQASGARADEVKSILEAAGAEEVHDA